MLSTGLHFASESAALRDAASLVPRLGRACLPSSIVGFFHGAIQPHPDQMQHAPINNPARYRLQKLGMGNAPEGSGHRLPIVVMFRTQ